MFKVGTLVPTNRGVIPIEQFGFIRKENEKASCITDIMLKTYTGEWNRCVFQTYKKSKGIKIKVTSHFYIECSGDQHILTPQGFKYANKLKVGDEICTYVDTYVDKNTFFTETEKIGYIPQNGNDIYIPKRMSEELAFVCGVLICPSTEIRLNDKDKLVVVCKDRILNKIFIRYIRDLFQTKQKMVVQDDKYCRIFSPYVIDFLNNLCGFEHKKQQIPQSLIQANRSIQISFFNSLIMSEEENIMGSKNFSYLYKIISNDVSSQIESLLYLYGYTPFIKFIKNKKTICIRKPVDEFFSDKTLDKMKKEARQSTTKIEEITSTKIDDYFGIICEKNEYAIKNIVFGVK